MKHNDMWEDVMMVRVSIGIPFYNSERTLEDAIRSVFAQSFRDWELILVDDGSVDRSLDIASCVDDTRVKLISDGCNRGLPYRLNQITSLASGEYIARMDSDDIMHPERIAAQVECLDENPEVEVLGTAIYGMEADGTILGVRGDEGLDTDPSAVLAHGLMIHPTVCGRADWFRNNPYDSRYVRAEDYELWCRTCNTTRFHSISQSLLFYRDGCGTRPRKYLKTKETGRTIIRRYGPRYAGNAKTCMLIAETYVKGAIYCLFAGIGLERAITQRRYRKLSYCELAEAEEQIEKVKQTPVPGLD